MKEKQTNKSKKKIKKKKCLNIMEWQKKRQNQIGENCPSTYTIEGRLGSKMVTMGLLMGGVVRMKVRPRIAAMVDTRFAIMTRNKID